MPAVLWLFFWLREDRKNPEPVHALLIAFIAGALAVPLAIWLEKYMESFIKNAFAISDTDKNIIIIAAWAFIEESLKFALAYISSLRRPYNDEPIDPLIYMITVALGFSALENFLFLLPEFSKGILFESILTGNYRFLGATLLHVLSSAVIGVALSFTFTRGKKLQLYAAYTSLIFATLLHFSFNYSLSVLDLDIVRIFAFVWLGIVALLIIFEKIKKIKY